MKALAVSIKINHSTAEIYLEGESSSVPQLRKTMESNVTLGACKTIKNYEDAFRGVFDSIAQWSHLENENYTHCSLVIEMPTETDLKKVYLRKGATKALIDFLPTIAKTVTFWHHEAEDENSKITTETLVKLAHKQLHDSAFLRTVDEKIMIQLL